MENRLSTGTSEEDQTYTFRIYASVRFKRFIGNQNTPKMHLKLRKIGKTAKMGKKVQSCFNLTTDEPIPTNSEVILGKFLSPPLTWSGRVDSVDFDQ